MDGNMDGRMDAWMDRCDVSNPLKVFLDRLNNRVTVTQGNNRPRFPGTHMGGLGASPFELGVRYPSWLHGKLNSSSFIRAINHRQHMPELFHAM